MISWEIAWEITFVGLFALNISVVVITVVSISEWLEKHPRKENREPLL